MGKKGSKKNRQSQKRKQRLAQKKAIRTKIQKKAGEAVRLYMRHRRKPISLPDGPEQSNTPHFLDTDTVSFAQCNGVGLCCRNRPLYVEPGDVYRIMRNERAIQKFGLSKTMDLYPGKDCEKVSTPLVYNVDEKSFVPFCAVYRVSVCEQEQFTVGGLI